MRFDSTDESFALGLNEDADQARVTQSEVTSDFSVSVTTFYNGEYRIGNGAWTPIMGQAQVASPSQTVKVWRSQVKRYADNCIVNPDGEGCPGVG